MLVGSGGSNSAEGNAVAISADGNTAIIGGLGDDGHTGAVWVFTRSGGVWSQQGLKLVGSSAIGDAFQGSSVAVSADGNTLIEGGSGDNDDVGAAWVFTRSGAVWTQQAKLIGTGYNGAPTQGTSVALSADGNTAIVGGPRDAFSNTNGALIGAAWVFTRSNGVWTQQGSKLVGSGYAGSPEQGYSVALSGDGSTALLGGPFDGSAGPIGAAWVFTLNNGVWAQQGSKLIGSDVEAHPEQGWSVALSADGNTAMLGGPGDNTGVGAAWIFTQSAGVWDQQAKLVGLNSVGNSNQGESIALSGDGNTAMIGGIGDNNAEGAVWAFVNNGGVWSATGPKLVGKFTGAGTEQGTSVALSDNGKTAIVGGPFQPFGGGAWIFVSPPSLAISTNIHDFNGDGYSDILWRGTGASPTTVAMWLMNGSSVLSAGSVAAIPSTYSIVGQHDFTGGGDADLLWRDTSGNLYMWFMNGLTLSSSANLGNVPTTWTVMGTADLNGDGIGDILWQDTAGDVAIWFMNGSTISSTTGLGTVPPASGWSIVAQTTGDILWSNTSSGALALWQVNGSGVQSSSALGTVPGNWMVQGMGDFNGDGVPDILWRDNNSGTVAIWFMNASGGIQSTASVGAVPTASGWNIAQTGDYNSDGYSDILWIDGSGDMAVWFMNSATVSSSAGYGSVGTTWQVQGINAE